MNIQKSKSGQVQRLEAYGLALFGGVAGDVLLHLIKRAWYLLQRLHF